MSAAPARPTAASQRVPFGSSSSDSIDQARFTPGTMLSDRYRIAGLIGRGGMGEVYRADDLKLRQPVALKFLPEALSGDPRKLERFLHEVRVARQVSHPNVCRVYDIGDADGQHFISMEYVDGEDLAAVLRRMGRPSPEKSLQIARQLCAGLAAAHDKGVLHRDLKPHNIMIDGEGRVRITDFGLAGFAEDFTGKEVLAGTPAYMAPEQLAGRSVSVKSDIFSLGLVLAELFTGKRVFDGANKDQILRSRSSAPTSLSTLTEGVDPAVERVILRCLESDPASRPSSALAVAAALPGADPLAAALAAGETPSPEMVAAAGDVGGVRPLIAVACLVAIIGGILALVPLTAKTSLSRMVSLPKPPAVLADRAAAILQQIGHTGRVVDTAYNFSPDWSYLEYVEKNDKSTTRWGNIGSVRPSPLYFWYRTSPRALVPASSTDYIHPGDPPQRISGMATVALDPQGRLLGLAIEPPQRLTTSSDEPPPTEADWSGLLSAAQVDLASFSSVDPKWIPETYCDQRAAWEGRFPDQPDVPIRVEVGAFRGSPVYMQIVAPWTKPWRMEENAGSVGEKVSGVLALSIVSILILSGGLLAYRNLKLRRSDRTGADRLAAVCTLLLGTSWLLNMDHVGEIWGEAERARNVIGRALVIVGVTWLWYLALEPYVRRRWPHVLISWSRLLAGRFRDPLLGRDLLVGGVAGLATQAIGTLTPVMAAWLGEPLKLSRQSYDWQLQSGLRFQVGQFLDPAFVFPALLILFLLHGLRTILRREWMSFVAVIVVPIILTVAGAWHDTSLQGVIFQAITQAIAWSAFLFVILRFGLLALAFTLFFQLLASVPVGWGLTGWQSSPSWTALLIVAAVAAYGFHTALAGRSLLRDDLLDG